MKIYARFFILEKKMSPNSFHDSLHRTSQTLTDPGLKVRLDPQTTMLLVIDVQERFVRADSSYGSDEAEKIAGRIQSLSHEFRKASIPACAVYFDFCDREKPDFYIFSPEKKDLIIRKEEKSAFGSSNIKERLDERGIKTLLACGFYKGYCVHDTVIDACNKAFSVFVLEDLVGEARSCTNDLAYRDMRRAGAKVTHSGVVLARLQQRK